MNYKLLRVRIKHFAFSKEAFAVRTAMLFIISKTFTTEHIFPDFFISETDSWHCALFIIIVYFLIIKKTMSIQLKYS